MYDLKNDKDQNILIESINVLETDKSDDWVNFNILDANIVKISPEPHKYAFFGLILGLVLGVFVCNYKRPNPSTKINLNRINYI